MKEEDIRDNIKIKKYGYNSYSIKICPVNIKLLLIIDYYNIRVIHKNNPSKLKMKYGWSKLKEEEIEDFIKDIIFLHFYA